MRGLELYTGYSDTLFIVEKLRPTAKAALRAVRRVENALGRPVHVAVTGKSGIAMAFAMAMLEDIQIVTIRKTNETSHGSKIEGVGTLADYVILDDFVDSGDTVRRVVRELADFAENRDGVKPNCVGFIEYCRLDGGHVDSVSTGYGTLYNCGVGPVGDRL